MVILFQYTVCVGNVRGVGIMHHHYCHFMPVYYKCRLASECSICECVMLSCSNCNSSASLQYTAVNLKLTATSF